MELVGPFVPCITYQLCGTHHTSNCACELRHEPWGNAPYLRCMLCTMIFNTCNGMVHLLWREQGAGFIRLRRVGGRGCRRMGGHMDKGPQELPLKISHHGLMVFRHG